MIIVGLTGGIASGKTTISSFLKKKRFAVHDSDFVVNKLYSKPKPNLLKILNTIKLSHAIKNKRINKDIIRNEIFNNQIRKRKLENFIHNEVRKSRINFLKKHKKKKTKIVVLDIPLLFEKKLTHICDYTILLCAPKIIKIRRAMQRKGITKTSVLKILKHQIDDKYKKKKANFIINTTKPKHHSFKMILEIINNIINNNA